MLSKKNIINLLSEKNITVVEEANKIYIDPRKDHIKSNSIYFFEENDLWYHGYIDNNSAFTDAEKLIVLDYI